MYAFVFGCILVLHGVSGNYIFPAWRTGYQNTKLEENQTSTSITPPVAPVYFLHKLNPAYWFYDNTQSDKLDKLYELVKCVIENEAEECRGKLQSSRNLFEKTNEKDTQKNSTPHKANGGNSVTEKNLSIQNRNDEGNSDVQKIQNSGTQKSSTVTEEVDNTTKI